MTREEAIKWLDFKSGDIYDHVFYGDEAPEWEDYEYEALRMAIEALERKRGEWIQHVNEPSLWSCSICETVIYSEHEEDRLRFHKWCGCCGADMRGGKDGTA